MTDEDTSPEALAALPPCTLCHDPAADHVLIEPLGILSGCTRPGCRCPAWGMAGSIDDDD